MPDPTLYLIRQQVIGCLPILAGHGYRIINGVGHLFIMEDGTTITIMVGSGYLIPNGAHRGSTGGNQMGTMVGHPCSRE